MPTMNMIQAIRSGLEVMLERDPSVCVFGEDVGYFGGVFRATQGLQQKFGPTRVFDTPLAEGGIIGVAIGMSINGLRPVPEIQFSDYMYPAFDQITNELAKLRYRSGGEWTAPMTIRARAAAASAAGCITANRPRRTTRIRPACASSCPPIRAMRKACSSAASKAMTPSYFFEPKRLYRGSFDGDPESVPPWRDQPEADVPDESLPHAIGRSEDRAPGKRSRSSRGARWSMWPGPRSAR